MNKKPAGASISVNGIEMYYEVHGDGPPLLLLHGFTGSGADLVSLFGQLASRYRLIIPDLRGHGRSTNPAGLFSFRQVATDIMALLGHLNVSQCSALGFSGGGCTLLQMAHQAPDLIKSMVVVSAVPYFPQSALGIMKQYAMKPKTQEEWEAMRRIHVYGDAQIEMLWRQAGQFGDDPDDLNLTPDILARIQARTLIVQGDRDPFYPIELTIDMYKSMTRASLWILPDSGHMPSEDFLQVLIGMLPKYV